ncbi:MAG: F0F1 ATP synthase subunit epsilon [SAR324 cluster bacterium]|nr:F0F1 ATP synthase subunit epsilon [SAR324 cluster bacterium]
MADRISLEIITPERQVFAAEVDWVTLPGSDGEMTILPEHVPIVTSLDSGVLFYDQDGQVSRMAVHYGYAQLQGNTLTVLPNLVERAEEIDLDRAREAEQRARAALQELAGKGDADGDKLKKNEGKLRRALNRQAVRA